MVVESEVEETSLDTAAGEETTAGDAVDVDSAAGVEDATGVLEDVAMAAAEEEPEPEPEVPKLLDAVVEAPLLISTLLTMTESPLSLVTLTSTVVVPKPELFSKKL